MPTCLFVLSRFFLRVDGVLFRLLDVRLFHSFSSPTIIREVRGREASYDDIKALLPPERPNDLTPLTDANWVAEKVGMLRREGEKGKTVGEARDRPRWKAEGRRLDVARLADHRSK